MAEANIEQKVRLAKRIWRQWAEMNKFQKMMVLVPVAAFIILLAIMTTGCQSNPNKDLVQLELENYNKMAPDYKRRIQADPKWDDLTKKVYIRWIDNWGLRLRKQLEAIEAEEAKAKEKGGK